MGQRGTEVAKEAADVVRLCAEGGVSITTQGGNTGLVGGGVPLHGEVVLDRGDRVEGALDVVSKRRARRDQELGKVGGARERIVGRTWPAADNHVVVLELTD